MKTDDEILADFIGKRLPESDSPQQWEFPFCYGYYPTLSTMKFKTEWNWIMPLFVKIAELGYRVNIHFGDNNLDGYCAVSNIDPMMNVVETNPYKTAVRFIKWYNQQPKP